MTRPSTNGSPRLLTRSYDYRPDTRHLTVLNEGVKKHPNHARWTVSLLLKLIYIDARGSGLTEADAVRGIARAMGIARGKLDQVFVIGDGYFVHN